MSHPPMPPAQRIDVGEVTLSVHLAGPEDGVPVLLMHGWPELALSWAQQIEDLAKAGYRVIAADNRGFGASDAPPLPIWRLARFMLRKNAGFSTRIAFHTAERNPDSAL